MNKQQQQERLVGDHVNTDKQNGLKHYQELEVQEQMDRIKKAKTDEIQKRVEVAKRSQLHQKQQKQGIQQLNKILKNGLQQGTRYIGEDAVVLRKKDAHQNAKQALKIRSAQLHQTKTYMRNKNKIENKGTKEVLLKMMKQTDSLVKEYREEKKSVDNIDSLALISKIESWEELDLSIMIKDNRQKDLIIPMNIKNNLQETHQELFRWIFTKSSPVTDKQMMFCNYVFNSAYLTQISQDGNRLNYVQALSIQEQLQYIQITEFKQRILQRISLRHSKQIKELELSQKNKIFSMADLEIGASEKSIANLRDARLRNLISYKKKVESLQIQHKHEIFVINQVITKKSLAQFFMAHKQPFPFYMIESAKSEKMDMMGYQELKHFYGRTNQNTKPAQSLFQHVESQKQVIKTIDEDKNRISQFEDIQVSDILKTRNKKHKKQAALLLVQQYKDKLTKTSLYVRGDKGSKGGGGQKKSQYIKHKNIKGEKKVQLVEPLLQKQPTVIEYKALVDGLVSSPGDKNRCFFFSWAAYMGKIDINAQNVSEQLCGVIDGMFKDIEDGQRGMAGLNDPDYEAAVISLKNSWRDNDSVGEFPARLVCHILGIPLRIIEFDAVAEETPFRQCYRAGLADGSIYPNSQNELYQMPIGRSREHTEWLEIYGQPGKYQMEPNNKPGLPNFSKQEFQRLHQVYTYTWRNFERGHYPDPSEQKPLEYGIYLLSWCAVYKNTCADSVLHQSYQYVGTNAKRNAGHYYFKRPPQVIEQKVNHTVLNISDDDHPPTVRERIHKIEDFDAQRREYIQKQSQKEPYIPKKKQGEKKEERTDNYFEGFGGFETPGEQQTPNAKTEDTPTTENVQPPHEKTKKTAQPRIPTQFDTDLHDDLPHRREPQNIDTERSPVLPGLHRCYICFTTRYSIALCRQVHNGTPCIAENFICFTCIPALIQDFDRHDQGGTSHRMGCAGLTRDVFRIAVRQAVEYLCAQLVFVEGALNFRTDIQYTEDQARQRIQTSRMIDNLSNFVNGVNNQNPPNFPEIPVVTAPQAQTLRQTMQSDQEAIERLMQARVQLMARQEYHGTQFQHADDRYNQAGVLHCRRFGRVLTSTMWVRYSDVQGQHLPIVDNVFDFQVRPRCDGIQPQNIHGRIRWSDYIVSLDQTNGIQLAGANMQRQHSPEVRNRLFTYLSRASQQSTSDFRAYSAENPMEKDQLNDLQSLMSMMILTTINNIGSLCYHQGKNYFGPKTPSFANFAPTPIQEHMLNNNPVFYYHPDDPGIYEVLDRGHTEVYLFLISIPDATGEYHSHSIDFQQKEVFSTSDKNVKVFTLYGLETTQFTYKNISWSSDHFMDKRFRVRLNGARYVHYTEVDSHKIGPEMKLALVKVTAVYNGGVNNIYRPLDVPQDSSHQVVSTDCRDCMCNMHTTNWDGRIHECEQIRMVTSMWILSLGIVKLYSWLMRTFYRDFTLVEGSVSHKFQVYSITRMETIITSIRQQSQQDQKNTQMSNLWFRIKASASYFNLLQDEINMRKRAAQLSSLEAYALQYNYAHAILRDKQQQSSMYQVQISLGDMLSPFSKNLARPMSPFYQLLAIFINLFLLSWSTFGWQFTMDLLMVFFPAYGVFSLAHIHPSLTIFMVLLKFIIGLIITWAIFYYVQGWSFFTKLVLPFFRDRKIFRRQLGEQISGSGNVTTPLQQTPISTPQTAAVIYTNNDQVNTTKKKDGGFMPFQIHKNNFGDQVFENGKEGTMNMIHVTGERFEDDVMKKDYYPNQDVQYSADPEIDKEYKKPIKCPVTITKSHQDHFHLDNHTYSYLLQYCNCKHRNEKSSWQQVFAIYDENGQETTHVTHSDCIMNLYCALRGRGGGSRVKPDPVLMREFEQFARMQIDAWIPILKNNIAGLDFSVYDFLQKFNLQKQNQYIDGFLSCREPKDYDLTYEANVKKKEVARLSVWKETTIRPRLIFCQPKTIQLMAGYFNHLLIMVTKDERIIDGFIQGLSSEGLQAKLDRSVLQTMVQIGADTSSHDAAQTSGLIKAVDVYLIQQIFDLICEKMIQGGLDMLPHQRAMLYQSCTSTKTKFKAMHKIHGRKVVLLQGTIDGTVFSGHATRTTFGNTVRVTLYLRFALRALLDRVVLWAAGDDASIWCEPGLVQEVYRLLFQRLYTDQDQGYHGLGQMAKKATINYTSVDFLSKAIVPTSTGFMVVRDPIRCLYNGSYTDTREATLQEVRDARVQALYHSNGDTDMFRQYFNHFSSTFDMESYSRKQHRNDKIRNVAAVNNYYQEIVDVQTYSMHTYDRYGQLNVQKQPK